MRAKLISEHINFEKKRDTLSSLGVGQRKLIKDWLDKMEIKNYKINDDFTIDIIKDDVIIPHKGLTELPFYINFRKVDGSFYCYENELTTLRGCPIKSFNFSCRNNHLYSLKWAPEYVSNIFSCYCNHLTSLEYLPKHIGGSIYCGDNDVMFTKEQVKKYCDQKNNNNIYV